MAGREIIYLEGEIVERTRSAQFHVKTEAGIVLAIVSTRLYNESDALRCGERVRIRYDRDSPLAAAIVARLPENPDVGRGSPQ